MLSAEQNETLTKIGPGTPMGKLLRRYWHPVAASSELIERPTKLIKILGESLVLYRDKKGRPGLVADTCAHRRASLLYGIPEEDGLRCAYHGWKYDRTGRCTEMPAEPAGSAFKERVRITGYPVEELGGLIFAYLGPEPAPLLPRWDLFVRDDALRDIGVAVVPCNWLQIMENGLDPVHVEWLHQHFNNYVLERLGREAEKKNPQHHEKIGFDVFEHGIVKRRVLEGETEANEDWQVGHPIIFPTILLSGSVRRPTFQIRVPVDDTHTVHWWYSCYVARPGVEVAPQEKIPFYKVPVPGREEDGEPEWPLLDNNSGQDMAMWYTQGPIADRSLEKLGDSDKGVILYRKLLKEEMEKSERGEDPMNVMRDPEKNVRIKLKLEQAKLAGRAGTASRQGGATKYSPVLNEDEAGAEKVTDIFSTPVK
ncbi:MAG TPA: Rieske 2Fe-2S domain-containing protein [Candidatus Binatia bacterium]|jgi:5,5'-dehydrodivanillate O-demethylase